MALIQSHINEQEANQQNDHYVAHESNHNYQIFFDYTIYLSFSNSN